MTNTKILAVFSIIFLALSLTLGIVLVLLFLRNETLENQVAVLYGAPTTVDLDSPGDAGLKFFDAYLFKFAYPSEYEILLTHVDGPVTQNIQFLEDVSLSNNLPDSGILRATGVEIQPVYSHAGNFKDLTEELLDVDLVSVESGDLGTTSVKETKIAGRSAVIVDELLDVAVDRVPQRTIYIDGPNGTARIVAITNGADDIQRKVLSAILNSLEFTNVQ